MFENIKPPCDKPILHHQIAAEIPGPEIDVLICEERETIDLVQGDAVIMVSKWQALELAKELLNHRDMLKKKIGDFYRRESD